MPTEIEQRNNILTILCQYLLFERKQETQLSMAFALLVQERHNQYHTLGEHKTGDESDFSTCSNEKCRGAFDLLKDTRSMAVEVSDLTIQMIADYTLKIRNEGSVCRAYLEPKDQVKKQSNLIIPGDLQ